MPDKKWTRYDTQTGETTTVTMGEPVTAKTLRAENERLRDAYQKIEDAPNEDIRKLAIAHMWTVLHETFGRDEGRHV